MEKTPVYCLYSSQMDEIFHRHFHPSFMKFNKYNYDLRIFETNVNGNGDYNTDEYIECLHNKTRLMLHTTKENLGRTIIWTDIDIKFFSTIDLTSFDKTFTALKEDENPSDTFVNPAFCKIECNDIMVDFFEKLLISCKNNDVHDMDVINYFADTIPSIEVGTFDFRYLQYTSLSYRNDTIQCNICSNNHGCYKCTHQLSNLDTIDTSKIILYHANCTINTDRSTSMELKLEQLNYLSK